nr:HAMP domain-containing sensor histidine kinase [Arenibaculum pallidiluteum]
MTKDLRPARIARLAAALFDAPMAALCQAEGDDLRLEAAVGADTPSIERGLLALCRRGARDGLVFEPDLRQDPSRTGEALPAGMGPGFRFAAAAALRGPDGEIVGALCVADRLPRSDTGQEGRQLLADLAALAVEGEVAAAGDGLAQERAAREAAERDAAEARERLEQEQRTRSRFLSAANHDLRQPFQALHLFLHLLQAKLTDPAQRELADRIEQAVRNGEAMLTGLLDLSALEMGRTRVTTSRIRLSEVLERLVEEFEPQTQAKGLRLRFSPTELEAETDQTLLERILRHILANAVRYTMQGSVLLGVRRRAGHAVIEVWDTGPGIAQTDRERIFEPFEQVASGAKGDQGGRLGLGLAIVERTARLLNITVELCSVPGRGSVFRIRRAPRGVRARARAPEARGRGGGGDRGRPRPAHGGAHDPGGLGSQRRGGAQPRARPGRSAAGRAEARAGALGPAPAGKRDRDRRGRRPARGAGGDSRHPDDGRHEPRAGARRPVRGDPPAAEALRPRASAQRHRARDRLDAGGVSPAAARQVPMKRRSSPSSARQVRWPVA